MPYFPSAFEMNRSLPVALNQVCEGGEQGVEQKKQLRSRVLRISQICNDAISELHSPSPDVGFILDSLELDALAILALKQEPKLSTWIINSVWASDCDRSKLAKSVEPKVMKSLQSQIPDQSSTENSLAEWLEDQCGSILLASEAFFKATDLCVAIGALIAMNALLANIIAGSMRIRFSTQFS